MQGTELTSESSTALAGGCVGLGAAFFSQAMASYPSLSLSIHSSSTSRFHSNLRFTFHRFLSSFSLLPLIQDHFVLCCMVFFCFLHHLLSIPLCNPLDEVLFGQQPHMPIIQTPPLFYSSFPPLSPVDLVPYAGKCLV